MNELVSVIIPVYNVENYLEKCVNSVCKQTYEHLEILLVDDGSKDSSGILCDQLAFKDSRIRVIHKENGGLSDARNVGIENAKGNYILLVDSDDSINIHMVEYLYDALLKTKSDVSICQLSYVYENDPVDITVSYENLSFLSFEGKDIPENLFNERQVDTIVAVCKLYKKELFKELRYRVGKVHEDEFMIHHLLGKCKKIVYINVPLYYYLQRDNSITTSYYSLKRLNAIEAYKERLDYYRGTRYEEKAKYHYLQLIIKHYFLVKTHYPQEKTTLEQLNRAFKETFKKATQLASTTRIRFMIFIYFKSIYVYLKKKGIITT